MTPPVRRFRSWWFLIAAGLLFGFGPVMSLQASVAEVYDSFDELLDRHVEEHTIRKNGLIATFEYHDALEDDGSDSLIRNQLERLKKFDPGQLDGKYESNAFWINAYNFFMIRYILDNPVDGSLIDSVWDYGGRINPFRSNVFEREVHNVGGEQYSLDRIEKEILLGERFQQKGWWDARVHFAVNCASVGCPPLRKEIYTAENMESYFVENTRRALNTPRQLRLEGNTLYVSKIFDWYEDDFLREADSVKEWIIQHGDETVERKVKQSDTIQYIEYDWSLNKPENFRRIEHDRKEQD